MKAKMSAKKKKLKSLPDLLGDAQKIFNKWVRLRDSDEPCIACGIHQEYYDAGHYVPQGASSLLRFNEFNTNKECKHCNAFDKFHLVGYRKNLIKKIGLENVEWLEENRRTPKKYSRNYNHFFMYFLIGVLIAFSKSQPILTLYQTEK